MSLFSLQVFAEEVGCFKENAHLGGAGEPVAFARIELCFMRNVELSEQRVELACFADGDNGVGFAVKDEGGGRLLCALCAHVGAMPPEISMTVFMRESSTARAVAR